MNKLAKKTSFCSISCVISWQNSVKYIIWTFFVWNSEYWTNFFLQLWTLVYWEKVWKAKEELFPKCPPWSPSTNYKNPIIWSLIHRLTKSPLEMCLPRLKRKWQPILKIKRKEQPVWRDPTLSWTSKPVWVIEVNFYIFHASLRKSKTSPPSARVAAMRFMLQQNCKTKLETPLKLFMKFSCNTLDIFFKHPWNFLRSS